MGTPGHLMRHALEAARARPLAGQADGRAQTRPQKKKALTFMRALSLHSECYTTLEVALDGHQPLTRSAGLAFRHVGGGGTEHFVDVVEVTRHVGHSR